MISVNHFATDLWTHPEVFDFIITGLPYVKSQRKVSSPSTLTAKLTKGFKDKYSLYILFPKELTEALNTIIHSKRGEITIRTVVLKKHVISVNVLTWTWAALFCSLWLVGLSLRNER